MMSYFFSRSLYLPFSVRKEIFDFNPPSSLVQIFFVFYYGLDNKMQFLWQVSLQFMCTSYARTIVSWNYHLLSLFAAAAAAAVVEMVPTKRQFCQKAFFHIEHKKENFPSYENLKIDFSVKGDFLLSAITNTIKTMSEGQFKSRTLKVLWTIFALQ